MRSALSYNGDVGNQIYVDFSTDAFSENKLQIFIFITDFILALIKGRELVTNLGVIRLISLQRLRVTIINVFDLNSALFCNNQHAISILNVTSHQLTH